MSVFKKTIISLISASALISCGKSNGNKTESKPAENKSDNKPDGKIKNISLLSVWEGFVDPNGTEGLADPDATDDLVDPDATDDLVDPDATDDLVDPDATDDLADPDATDDLADPDATRKKVKLKLDLTKAVVNSIGKVLISVTKEKGTTICAGDINLNGSNTKGNMIFSSLKSTSGLSAADTFCSEAENTFNSTNSDAGFEYTFGDGTLKLCANGSCENFN
ncbi:hypothetical protein QEJ31_14925 [Pigmentibacter sp. JX0631]|uniref:hypothetical protein n=1 Tax=Pigmentibacter sp. JX0631 TaxID=2976982 RepID=UPI002468E20D|nr:hypothetical protein [Pigmentibacter sp. JX0631]WGL59822.1 hypothetical protein QEJ31_14925 [Pigmentibacter sp. JX0631]